MAFTTSKYELELTIDFEQKTFTGNAKIHVSVTDPVKEFDLKISKNLDVEYVSFLEAKHVSRGHPDLLGHTTEFVFDKENDSIHSILIHEITSENIVESGFIEVNYKGKIGGEGDVDGIYHVEGINYEAKLNPDNVTTLFPILEDVSVPVKLSVRAPYRTGVEANIPAAEHHSVYNSDLFSNNFSTGDDSIRLSELELKINEPTALVLN